MILEEETYKKFGYYPSDLKQQSHKRILAKCDDCGIIREIIKAQYHSLCRKCVKECENNPNWKGGSVQRECRECGKVFYPSRGAIRRGWGKYCSCSCNTKARRHNAKPKKTQPEIRFEEICNKYSLPFHFIGDGSLWIGNANPDFIHKTRRLCIEVFGDYWHSPLLKYNIHYTHTLEGRGKQLKAEGYNLIVFWESDLKRKDAEAFVLYTLEKHNIFPSTT